MRIVVLVGAGRELKNLGAGREFKNQVANGSKRLCERNMRKVQSPSSWL